MPADERDDEPPSVNRRTFLRATAGTAAAGAGLTAASSAGSAAVECECTAAEASQCGPDEHCVCEEIPGGHLGAGGNRGPQRQTRCLELQPIPDLTYPEPLPECPNDDTLTRSTRKCVD